jgi:hypothetical protein|nr:MAG TPA_asm: Protein of unknown function (DUF551) [Caudoviricetes sp.]
MSHIKDRLIQLKNEVQNTGNGAYFSKNNISKIVELLLADLEENEKENGWIPVSQRLPEEHDSIFAKFKGTDNWKRGMFEKTSKYVIATVVFDDGTVLVEQAYTTDGIWKTDKKVLGGTVVAWMDYPEPYKED